MTTVIGKGDLAQRAADSMADITQAQVRRVIDAVFAQIAASAEAGHQVRVTGFGTFAVKDRAARTSRNPQTGQPIEVPAKRVLTFRPSKAAATA